MSMINGFNGVPSFSLLYPAYAAITPFTYQDGNTFAKMLEALIEYIDKTLRPHVDHEVQILVDAWNETVTTLMEAITNNSISLQDPVLAALIADVDSAARVALEAVFYTREDADELFAKLADVYSKTESDAKYATKIDTYTKTASDDKFATKTALNALDVEKADTSYVDAQILELANDLSTVEGRALVIEQVLATRLSQTTMDADYVRRIKDQHAIFIGSSNSHVNYGWTQALSAKRGWTGHNYSINGGSFSDPTHPDSFEGQLRAAIADNSYDKMLVRWFFVTDMSNDIRGNGSVLSQAQQLFSRIKTNYPNARIIVVPVVYTLIPVHQNDVTIRTSVSKRYAEVIKAGLPYPVEVIDNTWSWFWDTTDWLEAPGSYHLNGAGYTKLVWYIEQYLDGKNYDNQIPWTLAAQSVSTAKMGVGIRARRINGTVSASGTLTTFESTAQDTLLGVLPGGCGPVETIVVDGGIDSRTIGLPLYFKPNGEIVSMATIPGAITVWYDVSYEII